MATETITAAGDSTVTVHHHGAHVTSWKNSVGREMIYTSPNAIYNGEKAIRGGIPICFPQFGKKGPLKQHGFARNMPWTLDKQNSHSNVLRFILESNDITTSSEWPFLFHVAYTVTLSSDGNSLSIQMEVTNKDTQPFSFTTAFHSYFTCDAQTTKIPELDGIQYTDSIDPKHPDPKSQQGPVQFPGEVDRVYLSTPNTLSIPSAGLSIKKHNMPEAVVWNPYIERAAAMADLPDDAWKFFICIEPARIVEPAVLQPGEIWTCKCELASK